MRRARQAPKKRATATSQLHEKIGMLRLDLEGCFRRCRESDAARGRQIEVLAQRLDDALKLIDIQQKQAQIFKVAVDSALNRIDSLESSETVDHLACALHALADKL